MRHFLAWVAATALALGGSSAQAHHSMAMFDQTKVVSLTGQVREFQWTNPHCYIQLLVKDASGKDVEWSLEMGAPMYLYANGWRPRSIKPGDTVIAKINPLRNGSPGGVIISVARADGSPIGKQAG